MIRTHDSRLKKLARGAVSALTALGLAASGPGEALAQRRRAEPEANPQFQQSPGGGGGPIGDAEPQAPGAPADPDESPVPRQVQGVQIGATAPARGGGTASLAPLDMRVTVRVKGAPLATFLDTISAQAKVNFIITEGLESKRVTAFLQNVTVREALQVLLEIKGLTYQQIGKSNTYVVTPRSKQVENLITRIYTLSFIPLIPLNGDSASNPASSGGSLSGASSNGNSGDRRPPPRRAAGAAADRAEARPAAPGTWRRAGPRSRSSTSCAASSPSPATSRSSRAPTR
ncbi:MAG: STN domain-containing protein [Elusimicrobiota bacterium]|nr:MAG: STN domain-containing protein [Elusimicrobiota bacterium]